MKGTDSSARQQSEKDGPDSNGFSSALKEDGREYPRPKPEHPDAEPEASGLQQDFLQTILQTANCLVVVLDADGRIVLFNPACERATGFLQRDVLGHPLWERLLPPDEAAAFEKIFGKLKSGYFPIAHESMLVTLEGERREIAWSSTVLQDTEGEVEYVIATGIDISEKQRAVEQLRDREQRLQAIFANATEGIITIDEDGLIESLNPAVETMFGYERAELWGANINMLMPSPYRENHDGYLRKYKVTGVAKIIGKGRRVFGRKKDGSVFPLHLSVSEVWDGRHLFLGILVDLSHQEKFEREILRAVEEEQQRIARELHDGACSSLTGIQLLASRLRKKLISDGSEREREARQLENLIRQVYQELRLASHVRTPRDPQDFRLEPALEDLKHLTELASEIQVGINVETAQIQDPIKALHLYRIAQEAVQNAIKHAAPGRIELSLYSREGALTLEVSDDGNGFDSEATARQDGLGLRSMKYRASLMGGELKIESSPGAGTVLRCVVWNP